MASAALERHGSALGVDVGREPAQRLGRGARLSDRQRALAAGRQALTEISEKLAKADMAAFETQGRFIQSRYSEKSIDG